VLHDVINDESPQGGREGRRPHQVAAGTPAAMRALSLRWSLIRETASGSMDAATVRCDRARRLRSSRLWRRCRISPTSAAFVSTVEANAAADQTDDRGTPRRKTFIYSNLFTGVHGNYLRDRIVAAGLDPDDLPESGPSRLNFGSGGT